MADMLNASPAIAGLASGDIPFITWMGVRMSGTPGGYNRAGSV